MHPFLFFTDSLQLIVNIVKVLHVLSIALLLVSQLLLLTIDVLFLTLGHYHSIFPSLEVSRSFLFGFTDIQILNALTEGCKSNFELIQMRSELI